MSKTYNKLDGEVLTPEEASLAANSFSTPSGYNFVHWSSSSNVDYEVTELNTGGAGIVVKGNLTYYPVIKYKPIIDMSLADGIITYNINEITGLTHAPLTLNEGYFALEIENKDVYNSRSKVNIVACPKTTTNGTLTITGDNGGGVGIEGGTSGTMPYFSDTPAVDFGVINLPNITTEGTQKLWEITSEIDGEVYTLEGYFAYVSFIDTVSVSYAVYKTINGVRVKMQNLNLMYRFV